MQIVFLVHLFVRSQTQRIIRRVLTVGLRLSLLAAARSSGSADLCSQLQSVFDCITHMVTNMLEAR